MVRAPCFYIQASREGITHDTLLLVLLLRQGEKSQPLFLTTFFQKTILFL